MRLAHSARIVVAILATLLLGAVIGLVGVFEHPAYWTVGGQRLPAGVLAGIAALLLAQYVARDAVPFGLGPAVVLLSWTLTMLVFGSTRPEGDIALPAGAAGEGFLYGGFLAGLLFAGGLAVLPARASGRPRAGR